MQNSRGFRALKVWLALRAAGRSGYEAVIRGDIELARRLYELADAHPELRAASCHLSITTFRYVPPGIDDADDYLNTLNKALLAKIQASGDFYVSNAVVDGVYLLRACVVNFRTTNADMDAIAESVVAMGRTVHAELGGPA
jgi:aromatic-L-amino-acid decarboxylase